MTERLADINARIAGMHQLGAVVNAMRGIAAARAQQARAQLAAVDSYASAIAQGIGRAMAIKQAPELARAAPTTKQAIVLFCAEQGFAGAFNERVIDAVHGEFGKAVLFVVGSRGIAKLGERGIVADWHGAMPAQSVFIPKFADRIAEALYQRIAAGTVDQLDVVHSQWSAGHGVRVLRRCLFPLDVDLFSMAIDRSPPLQNLRADELLASLTSDYVHAELCQAALHAFAAENQARMEAMAAAHRQVATRLIELHATQRRIRQEEITAEIIELAAGASADENTGATVGPDRERS